MAKVLKAKGKVGLYRRSLVPLKARQKIIERIKKVPEDKRSSDHWWELGETIVLNGLLKEDESLVQEGMKYLKKATQINPPSISAFMDLGWLLMHRKMELFALEYFEQASKLSATSRDLYALLAICHARLGNRKEALSSIKRATMSSEAVALDFELQAALEEEESERFIQLSKNIQFLKISPNEAIEAGFPVNEIFEVVRMNNSMLPEGNDSVEAIESLAEIDYIANDYDSAQSRLERIVKSGDATAKSFVTLGLIAFKEGDEDRALVHYQKALELDNEHFLANVNYTHIKANRNEYTADVVKRLRWAVDNRDKGDPRTSAAAMSNLGNYLAINGEFEEDIKLQESALLLHNDDDSVSPINLFATFLAIGEINKATRIFEKYRKNFKTHNFYPHAKTILKTFKAMAKDPMFSLEVGFKILNDEIPLFNQMSLVPLVSNIVNKAKLVPPEFKEEFYTNLGHLANAVGSREVSAECWKRLGAFTGDQTYFMNYAIDLSMLGHNEQAVKVLSDLDDSVKSHNERTCSMSAVIYNKSGEPEKAKEMLEKGLTLNPSFSLLYSNYFGLTQSMELSSQKDKMIQYAISLIPADTSNANLQYHLASFKAAQGNMVVASELVLTCFFCDGEAQTSDMMRNKDAHKNESDVSDLFDNNAYKTAAQILYRAGRISECQQLLEVMRADKTLADGDSLVGLQSVARRSPDKTIDTEILDGMGDQVPVLIEKAISAIEQQDIDTARSILEKFDQMANEGVDIEDFNHLEGKPLALIEALKAQYKLATGHKDAAIEHLQKAIKIDDQTPYVYETFIDIGSQSDASFAYRIASLAEERLMGSPWIRLRELSAAIELNDYSKVSELLKTFKSEFTALLPTGRYQSYLETILLESDIQSNETPEWMKSLQEPNKTWLTKAYQLLCAGHEEASVIYLMKWFEDSVNQVFAQFKLLNQKECQFTRETPFSSFIEGSSNKMNLGAMVTTLSIGIRPSAKIYPEHQLVAFLRKHSSGLNQILNEDGISQLRVISKLRNCLMHTTPVDSEEIHRIRVWLMTDSGELGEVTELFAQS